MKTALYPGSFDPVTLGHLDIIQRASQMFDTVIVAVMCNSAKTPLFTLDERVKMIKESVKDLDNVVIESFDGLLINYCREKNITVFLTTNLKYSYLSSSVVKEIASYNGDITPCVPDFVADALYKKYGYEKRIKM